MRRLPTALALSLVFAGSALAGPAMTTTNTLMRESPNSHARVVQPIPANAQIDVQGCGPVWCSASWRNMDGFVRVSAVAPGGGPPLAYGGPPPPPPVVVAPFGFGYYYGWGHPWHPY